MKKFARPGIILALLTLFFARVYADEPNSITSPDTEGDVGEYTSLVLDSAGNPVVSYYDDTNFTLKVLHCNDPNCDGGDESITSPDPASFVGWFTSLALDSAGNPVVSYQDFANNDLKLLHCNDPNCAGGDESITSPDTDGDVGRYTSLVLDDAGNPVVSYFDTTSIGLKILHCNDPDCIGGDESISFVDPLSAEPGTGTSLTLDSAGNPVVSYNVWIPQFDLKLLHCNDPNCVGGDESISSPDTEWDTGFSPSLVLDSAGNPVVSYYDAGFSPGTDSLNVLHCNDPNCVGNDESITSPDVGDVGSLSSLTLDNAGNPVVSYHDIANGDLKVLHCDDPNCDDEGESITSPDMEGAVGRWTSLALDSAGNPVVSYHDYTNQDLKLLHCGNPTCNTAPTADAGGPYQVEEGNSITLDSSGSFDPEQDNTTLDYAWDYDGDEEFDDAFGMNPTFSAAALDGPAVITIGLQVTDDGGLTDEDYTTVTIDNMPPALENVAVFPPAGDEADTFTLSGTIADPGVLDSFIVTVDWVDGNVEEFNYPAGTTNFTITHPYLDDDPSGTPTDTYLISLQLADDDGGTDSASAQVTVNNVAPAVQAGPDVSVQAGVAITFSGTFTDPGILDTHTILWDFGDGATASGTLTPAHAYTTPGVYTVTLTVSDDDLGVGVDSLLVTVQEGNPRLFLPLMQNANASFPETRSFRETGFG